MPRRSSRGCTSRPESPSPLHPGRLPSLFKGGSISLAIPHENLDDKIYARLRSSIVERLAILEALRQRKPDASEAAMRLLVRRSLERLEKEAEVEKAEARLEADSRMRSRKGG